MTPKNVLLLITPSSPGRFKGISIFALSHGWHLTVAEIARRTGYCNPAYLVNVFRDATGLSPKKWRNSGMR